MKSIQTLLTILPISLGIVLGSCQKDQHELCIKETFYRSDHMIWDSDKERLGFRYPMLDSKGIQIIRFEQKNDGQTVYVRQFFKGLPLLETSKISYLNAGSVIDNTENPDSIVTPQTPNVELNELAELAYETIEEPRCYQGVWGIYNLKTLAGRMKNDYVLAWKITPGRPNIHT